MKASGGNIKIDSLMGPDKFRKSLRPTSKYVKNPNLLKKLYENNLVLRQFYPKPKPPKKEHVRNGSSSLPMTFLHVDLLVIKEPYKLKAIFLISAICSYSRMAFMVPIKSKDEKTVVEGFKKLLHQMKFPLRVL